MKAKAFFVLTTVTTITVSLVTAMAVKPGIIDLVEGIVCMTLLLPLPLLGQLATPDTKPKHD